MLTQRLQTKTKYAFIFGLLLALSILASSSVQARPTTDTTGGGGGCVIPSSGPWPACATGGETSNTSGSSTSTECVIPDSGPWPACATGGATAPTTDGGNSSSNTGCVIPSSGPWPPCATGGSTTPSSNTGNSTDCIIPESGPWPACATGGATAPTTDGGNGSSNASCVIPESGPWPPCATGGSTTTTPVPPTTTDNTNQPPAPSRPTNANRTNISIDDTATIFGAKRLGINVGGRDQFGAAQILKNLMPNPGFESSEFTQIILVGEGSSASRVQSDNWETIWNNDPIRIGQPTAFWAGGNFEVLTGNAKGRSGTINGFTHENQRYTWYLDGGGAKPNPGDVIIVRKEVAGFDTDLNQFTKAKPWDVRPGSPGQQSLRLLPTGSAWRPSYQVGFDSFARDVDASAGNLIHVDGKWIFEVWAKATTNGDTLNVVFQRVGENIFFDETFPLTTGWQKITHEFTVDPNIDAPTVINLDVPRQALTIDFKIGFGNEVLIDDVNLMRGNQANSTVFSDTYVNLLRELRPGIIRNWGFQLGTSLDNQLSTEFARQPSSSSPEDRVALNYHYSVHEFLELAKQTGSEPWYVIPPTWSPQELQNFIAYLSAPAGSHAYATRRADLGQSAPWTDVLGQIHLEYGNEIWGSNFNGDPFIGATVRGGIRAGQIANDRIDIMKASPYYNAGKYNMVIGGQTRFAGRQREIEQNSSSHDQIGFAPYFGVLADHANEAERYYPLFAHARQNVENSFMTESRDIIAESGKGTGMAIYEINVHAIEKWAPIDVRNEFLTSQGSGIGLSLAMLTYQRDMGIRNQAAYQSAQYSTKVFTGEQARLFGMLRDVEATGRKRPTWLGLELVNKAVKGNMITTTHSGGASYTQQPMNDVNNAFEVPYVQSFAFKSGNSYSIVVYNLSISENHNVSFQLPAGASGGATVHTLTANYVGETNETAENIRIYTKQEPGFGSGFSMTLAPHSAYVIEWQQ